MNERSVLILLSAIAAIVVTAPIVWLLGVTDSEPTSPIVELRAHLHLTVPAMSAVAMSAWWHTRGTRLVDCEDFPLSSSIAWWSFPIFAAVLIVVFVLDGMIFADRVAGLASDLAAISASVFLFVMLASLVLFFPALFLEYAVVRLVRSKRMRAVLSGVES